MSSELIFVSVVLRLRLSPSNFVDIHWCLLGSHVVLQLLEKGYRITYLPWNYRHLFTNISTHLLYENSIAELNLHYYGMLVG